MASIVACIHNCHATYPDPTPPPPSSPSHVILATLLRHDHHRHHEDTVTSYGPINPYCEECEDDLLRQLTMDVLPLSYFSAEHVVHSLRQLVHHTRCRLVEAEYYQGCQGGARVEEVCYGIHCYFESRGDHEAGFGTGEERLVKITVDGGWGLHNDA